MIPNMGDIFEYLRTNEPTEEFWTSACVFDLCFAKTNFTSYILANNGLAEKKNNQIPQKMEEFLSNILMISSSMFFVQPPSIGAYFGGSGTRTQPLQLPSFFESPLPNRLRTKNGGLPYHGCSKPCSQTSSNATCKL